MVHVLPSVHGLAASWIDKKLPITIEQVQGSPCRPLVGVQGSPKQNSNTKNKHMHPLISIDISDLVSDSKMIAEAHH